MAIVGNIIKTIIDVGGNLLSSEIHPVEEQEKVLRDLLGTAKDTEFGKHYNFECILDSEDVFTDFANNIPIHTYEKMHSEWWNKQEISPGITWPGHPNFFARTSGTAGNKSKRIPITNEMSDNMKVSGTQLIKELHHYDIPAETFEKEILMLSSSCNLTKNEKGFLEGEISGINIYNFPDWYEMFYRPGKEIAAIDNWDERIKRIVEEAVYWDISVIAGIPSWVKVMLQEVIKAYELKNIHEIWPNLKVYVSGGVAFDPFKKSFDAISKDPLIVLDTYLATEGFFGYSNSPRDKSLKLVINAGIYYEFIPFNNNSFYPNGEVRENPKVLNVSQIENDQEYALLVSTCSGAWRYIIGDTVKFVDKERMKFVISGRTKFFLNVVGSQLSENKLDAAVKFLAKELDVEINQYSVSCINENGSYYHQWILACNSDLNCVSCSKMMDKKLQSANNNYKVARNKALKGVKVICVSEDAYANMLEFQKKKGGQVKTPKVVEEERMREMIQFFNSINKF